MHTLQCTSPSKAIMTMNTWPALYKIRNPIYYPSSGHLQLTLDPYALGDCYSAAPREDAGPCAPRLAVTEARERFPLLHEKTTGHEGPPQPSEPRLRPERAQSPRTLLNLDYLDDNNLHVSRNLVTS